MAGRAGANQLKIKQLLQYFVRGLNLVNLWQGFLTKHVYQIWSFWGLWCCFFCFLNPNGLCRGWGLRGAQGGRCALTASTCLQNRPEGDWKTCKLKGTEQVWASPHLDGRWMGIFESQFWIEPFPVYLNSALHAYGQGVLDLNCCLFVF